MLYQLSLIFDLDGVRGPAVMRSKHAVGDIIRPWKRDEGLDPEFHGSAGRFSVSEHEMGLIRGLMVSRPDTSCS